MRIYLDERQCQESIDQNWKKKKTNEFNGIASKQWNNKVNNRPVPIWWDIYDNLEIRHHDQQSFDAYFIHHHETITFDSISIGYIDPYLPNTNTTFESICSVEQYYQVEFRRYIFNETWLPIMRLFHLKRFRLCISMINWSGIQRADIISLIKNLEFFHTFLLSFIVSEFEIFHNIH